MNLTESQKTYFDWSSVLGYNAPIYVVIGQRGIGKTFGIIKKHVQDFIDDNNKRFIYVCSTLTQCETLAQNQGEKFFAALISFYQTHYSVRNQKYLNALLENKGNIEEHDANIIGKIAGNTIRIGGVTAGYLLSVSDFSNLKRNNFENINGVIFDEFIAEKYDITTLTIPRRFASVVQSIARTKNVHVYLLGNAVRRADPFLQALKLQDVKVGEKRKIKDKYGLLIFAQCLDPQKYQLYNKKLGASVSGRFSKFLEVDNLEKNQFADDVDRNLLLPAKLENSKMLMCLHLRDRSLRINQVGQMAGIYVLEDYGKNKKLRFTFDRKTVKNGVVFNDAFKSSLFEMFQHGLCRFQNNAVYLLFREILGLI